ncbi:MAG: glycosyltransferase [Candidatus Faecousia sp.]|nr:glycosyltransferase [Candidatus Faecousia sp.]
MLIPKILHFCWFGGNEKPEIVQKCIRSWHSVLPEYQIIEWNEDNFDVRQIPYTAKAYDQKKYAFVSDYARLKILQEYGGIYVDTDVEVIRPLDSFLSEQMFCGFESRENVAPGLILGCVPNHPLLPTLMRFYLEHGFVDSYGVINTYSTVLNMTDVLRQIGLQPDSGSPQSLSDVTVYPKITFCPDEEARKRGVYTDETYTVHHYCGSWLRPADSSRVKRLSKNVLKRAGKVFRKLLGNKRWERFRNRHLKRLYDFARGI